MPGGAGPPSVGCMNTSTLQRPDRPEDTGPAASPQATRSTDDEVRFWALVDLVDDTLNES